MEDYRGFYETCSVEDYHVEDHNFKLGECLYNAYKEAKESGALIVEGIIKINCQNYSRHAWNKIGDIYFDVTKEHVFEKEDFKNEMKNICKDITDELSYSYIKCIEYPISSCNMVTNFAHSCQKELLFHYSYDKLIEEANKGNLLKEGKLE